MLDAPPNRPNDPLVTPTILKHIVGQAAFQLAVLYGMLVTLQHYGGGGGGAAAAAAATASSAGGGLEAAMAALFTAGGGGGGASAATAVAAAAASAPHSHSHVLATTMVFNTFVQIQLFNQFNCRRIRDEPNIFEGLAAHPLFLAIVAGEAVLQYLIVQYGGEAFSTTPLTAAQWALCGGLGAASLLVRQVLRRVHVGEEEGGRGGDAEGRDPREGRALEG
ncbi:hypothetical protein PLESTB_001458000 [Pleodorina starrii]|uniref:Cation-transporting P-type ATPase C-terminal domain-containing protein n=1 Tax=Pleodorina starrii TaxID=330485 RepID=A0A9W6BVV1_9CHLO|nr:hypothetical protein PLESTB_001458000 [Pleodorina starrii]